jgi:pimeloyl-ACP methyl ester carboxylesterase
MENILRLPLGQNIEIQCLDHAGSNPPLILLHGLAVTADIFEGLIRSGLSPKNRAIALDLRGRGGSSAPPAGKDPWNPAANYTMEDHASDVLGTIDALKLEQPILIGHSFGGLLAYYLAAKYPARFPRLIVLDAAPSVATPATKELLRPTLERLGVVAPSWEVYRDAVRNLPFLVNAWDPGIERFFRRFVEIRADGSVRQRLVPEAVLAAMEGTLIEDWHAVIRSIQQPTLLLNAEEPYGPPGSPPFVTPAAAASAASQMPRCTYFSVPGNHVTMIFGTPAQSVAKHIRAFLDQP